MTPVHWALLPFKRYADFTGRSPRAEYWWYLLAMIIAGGVFGFLDGFLLGGPIYGGLGPLGLAFTAATVVPGTALLVRRLHDTEISGWWALIRVPNYLIIATGTGYGALGAAIGRTSGALFVAAILGILAFCLAGFYVFLRVVSEGDGGPNRYGPDPYGPDELEAVFA
jgi:uncharacterized membrane protein YhaH (DUF805 family)